MKAIVIWIDGWHSFLGNDNNRFDGSNGFDSIEEVERFLNDNYPNPCPDMMACEIDETSIPG